MKIIHITDTHLVADGHTIYGLDPAARLEAVVSDVVRRHPDADLTVITGDLTDLGEAEAYRRLAAIVERLPMPVRLLIGNHDNRQAFSARFPDHPHDEHGFVQSWFDMPHNRGRLLFLDTNEPGWSGGRYCETRLSWLSHSLQEVADRPAYLFMHHPPFQLGVAHFEQICLAQPDAFHDVLAQHSGGIGHIFFGHVHIPVTGTTTAGIPFTGGRGCNHQIVLDFEARDCTWASGSPNYNIIILKDGNVFVHAFDLFGAEQIGLGAYPTGP
jgi:3',5'-cyclic AMP phosphodiesterase CpdA